MDFTMSCNLFRKHRREDFIHITFNHFNNIHRDDPLREKKQPFALLISLLNFNIIGRGEFHFP